MPISGFDKPWRTKSSDLRFLGRERSRRPVPRVCGSSRRSREAPGAPARQTPTSPIDGEHVVRGAQLLASVAAAAVAAQPFAVEQMRAGQFDAQSRLAQSFDRVAVARFRNGALARERLHARIDAQRPIGRRGASALRNPRSDLGERVGLAASRRRLGELRRGKRLVAEHVAMEHAPGALERARMMTEAVVQHGGRVVGERHDPALTLRGRGSRQSSRSTRTFALRLRGTPPGAGWCSRGAGHRSCAKGARPRPRARRRPRAPLPAPTDWRESSTRTGAARVRRLPAQRALDARPASVRRRSPTPRWR